MRLRSLGAVPTRTFELLPEGFSELVLVIPGNPGIASLYRAFVRRLVELGEGRFGVAVASHAGHAPGLRGPQGDFGLDAQIEHHLRFLEQLSSAPRVHVVGHSIGAWLTLEVLERISSARRGQGVLLLPTVEGMAKTPAGRKLLPFLGRGAHLLRAVAGGLRKLPFRDALLERALLTAAPEATRAELLEGLAELSDIAIGNALELAAEELATVLERPEPRLEALGADLTIIYGERDPWNLPTMVEAMMRDHPAVRVLRAPPSVGHAFVLEDVEWVARAVIERLSGGV